MGEVSDQVLSAEVKERRHEELAECFAVIDTCLRCYYDGETHMYRALAGQLRILLCNVHGQKPLLSRVFPDLQLNCLKPIEWLIPSDLEIFPGSDARLAVDPSPGEEFRLARMPFLMTVYPNGLQIADLQFMKGKLITLNDWTKQLVRVSPSEISIDETIRSVADKGGGAHVDDTPNQALQGMMVTGPRRLGVHILFVVALGRLAQEIGLY